MTRLAFLSDIHGNLPALEAVIDDMQAFHPDHVIVVGDSINGAPFDAEVMETIIHHGWTAIRGNHEFYLLDYKTPREHVRIKSMGWVDSGLKIWFPYIAAMPDSLTLFYRDAPPIFVTHGLPGNPFDAVSRITPDSTVESWLKDIPYTTYVCGHYHLSVDRQVGKWHIVNPGPVGAVMDGTHDACYVLLDAAGDHWEATFRRVPYDYARVEAAFADHDLRRVLGVEGLLKCEQLRRGRNTISGFNDWLKVQYPDESWSYKRAYEYLSMPLQDIWHTLGESYWVNPEIPLPPPIQVELPTAQT